MNKKFFVLVLVAIMLFAVMSVGANCGGDKTFETALADVVKQADGKPILIYLSKTN